MRAALLIVFVGACGGSSAGVDASQTGDDGSSTDAVTCSADEVACGDTCVDLATDPMHCGSCANACPASLGSCQSETCVPQLATAWEVHFGAGSFPGFWLSGVDTDAAGNVYVAGTMNGTIDLGGGPLSIPGGGGSGDILVASFTPTGAHRWSRIFGSAAGESGDRLVLSQGTLYVLGTFRNTVDFGGGPLTSAGAEDIVVIGLNATTGAYASARRYGNAGDDSTTAITADASGNVTIGGNFLGTIDFGGGPIVGGGYVNGFVASFTPSGAHLWSKRVAAISLAASSSTVMQLAADAQGNVAVTGSFKGTADFGTGSRTSADNDVFVSSYSNTGALRWLRILGGAGYDYGYAVAVNGSGDVYVGGTFHGPSVDFGLGTVTSAGASDGFLVALTGTTGVPRFARALGSSVGGNFHDLHIAADGNVLATGVVDGTLDLGLGATASLGSYDLYLASFAGTTGASRWGKRYGGTDYESAMAITSGPSGELLVAGETFSNPTDLGTGPFAILGTADNGFVMKVVP